MIRVFEALQLEAFQEFQLQSGQQGLEREIANVTILDYETDARDYSAFRPGDFILSSLYFAKDDESLILEAFRALVARGISGFAIKTVYYFTISDKLRQMADAAGVPVFTFRTTSMEDIIIAASQLMREKDLQTVQAGLLDQLLRPALEEQEVGGLARQLDPQLAPWCMAAYATFRPGVAFPPLPFRQTNRGVALEEQGLRYAPFVYQKGVLLLLTARQPLENARARELLLAKLAQLRLPSSACQVGLGLPGATHRQLDACVSQSLQANRLCRLWGRDLLQYDQLGAFRFLLPLLSAPGCLEVCRRQREVLLQYDRSHSSNLWDTLVACVRCGWDINRAAPLVYQHPNTLRYRLKKIRQLWGEPQDFDQQALLCVQLCQLAQELEDSGI